MLHVQYLYTHTNFIFFEVHSQIDLEEKVGMARALFKYKVSILEYTHNYKE